MRKCECCPRNGTCPMETYVPAGQVIAGPTSEHCCVERINDTVVKHMRPRTRMSKYELRKPLTEQYPEIFEPFEVVGRTIVQAFIPGARATEEERRALLTRLRDLNLRPNDVCTKNIVGGRIIDFDVAPEQPFRRRGSR